MKTHSYDWTKKLHKKYLHTMDSKAQSDKQEEEYMTLYTPGKCLNCDNVGPITVDGFTCFFLFRGTCSNARDASTSSQQDLRTKRHAWTFCTKYILQFCDSSTTIVASRRSQ